MNYKSPAVPALSVYILTNLIKECNPDAQVYNLDIVRPGTPTPEDVIYHF